MAWGRRCVDLPQVQRVGRAVTLLHGRYHGLTLPLCAPSSAQADRIGPGGSWPPSRGRFSAPWLEAVTRFAEAATTTYTYDSFGRVRTVTDENGYTITTEYDGLNRPTRVTYPDGTFEETTYDRLHVATRRDRLGRLTRYTADALAARGESRPGSHALRSSASHAIVQVDCSGVETSRLKEFEIPS